MFRLDRHLGDGVLEEMLACDMGSGSGFSEGKDACRDAAVEIAREKRLEENRAQARSIRANFPKKRGADELIQTKDTSGPEGASDGSVREVDIAREEQDIGRMSSVKPG